MNSCLRRSQSVAPTTKRSSHLTGFIRLEAVPTSSPVLSQSPSRKRSSSTGSTGSDKSGARWLYAVLSRDSLRCFARRADYKMQHPPVSEHTLDLVPTAENPKAFTFDHECVYVRCRTTGKAMTIRLHESAKINQWVTALYYQALASSSSSSTPTPTLPKSKSVSFIEVPQVSILPDAQEPVDKDELFYSKKDYAEFLQRWKEDALATKSPALVRVGERCK